MEGAGEGRTGDWGEVVTRYPYENVGMDHLLSMEKKKIGRYSRGAKEKKEWPQEKAVKNSYYLVLRDHKISQGRDIVL